MCGTVKEAQKRLDYLIEENRRKTFKKWIFTDRDPCNADKMAEAGFIFTGSRSEPDVVECFLCYKSLDGWDSTDDPWQEHLRHSPNCCFAKLQKAQDNLTVREFIDIIQVLTEGLISSYYGKKAEDIKKQFEDYEQKIISRLEKIEKQKSDLNK